MRNYIHSLFILAGFAGGLAIGCGTDGGGGVCDAGTELCECISGQCLGGLECDAATNICVQGGGTNTTGSDTDGATTGNTGGGGGDDNEKLLCGRLDECNYLEAGVSATDCADGLALCTADLISSQYADWNNEAVDCLEKSNCKNFQDCLTELPDCSPVEGGDDGTCVTDGMPCDFCWADQTCPLEYIGTDDGCDCDCGGGVTDPDCG